MLSLNPPKPPALFHHNQSHISSLIQHPFPLHKIHTPRRRLLQPISARASPSNPPTNQQQQQQQLYQPFRPPPSPIPSQFRNLDIEGRLEILQNRLGLWYEYATLIPSLLEQGFTPASIEEDTGISGVDQNRLVVAAQVRDTLAQAKLDPETLSFFDNGGDKILNEIRLLSISQRTVTARYMVQNRFDARAAQELARSIKDFPKRRGDKGWESFDYLLPGDCLAFMYFRQSRENKNPSDARTAALERALEVAQSDKAKNRVLDEMNLKSSGEGNDIEISVKVPVVRLKMGELSESSSTMVVFLPACKAEEGEIAVVEAPGECTSQGEFGVVEAEKGWKRWVVLPGWEPMFTLKRGIVVEFRDARVLPWKVNRWYKEESILVVVERERKEVVAEDGFYLISDSKQGDNGFKVERGSKLMELGVKECMGTVVVVVRPPKEETDEDQLADEDWE